ncbi:MAG: protein translocase subunit SecF [Rhodothermales bacterium]|nr:protein translocase subunit SecF [Rhodothermales bacterium]
MRVFESLDFPFVDRRRVGYVISGVLLVLSIISLATRGLELGIDFKGGQEFVIGVDGSPEVTAVRDAVSNALGQSVEVKSFGSDALLVRTTSEEDTPDADVLQSTIVSTIQSSFEGSNPRVEKRDIVGPRFADDLKRGAIYSVFGSLLVIFLYILIRFEWKFSVGAVAALFHDVTITLGLFSFLHGWLPFSLQIDQAIIAAFLTIVGYSLNDTVVIFDRIREYATLFKTQDYNSVVNRSINRTLSRTVVTSGTTLLVVATLFIFGGEVLRGFAFALIIGVIIGTYSSIFVASPIVVELKARAN